jgi:TPP-dependent trihydroxycyclohexane-1,2-dione (THcHDO) dehydratase
VSRWTRCGRPRGLAGGAAYRERAAKFNREWDAEVQKHYDRGHAPLPSQGEVIGAVNTFARPQDVVVCAAGSLPGDLHKLWRTRDPRATTSNTATPAWATRWRAASA